MSPGEAVPLSWFALGAGGPAHRLRTAATGQHSRAGNLPHANRQSETQWLIDHCEAPASSSKSRFPSGSRNRINRAATWRPDRQGCPATICRRGYWVVVVSVDFRVVVSPDGETVVPLVVVWVLSVIPLPVSVVWLLLELLPPYTKAGVVDWVDVVLEDEVCARATPVIIARAVVTTRKDLNMSRSP
jgi:hypothetical protein